MEEKRKRTRVKNARVRIPNQKKASTMAELTKAQMQEQMDKMKTVDGIMDLILDLSAEDTQQMAQKLKTTQKGIQVHASIMYGIKQA
jgi:hypothetical protein